jgi:hypothetical protein
MIPVRSGVLVQIKYAQDESVYKKTDVDQRIQLLPSIVIGLLYAFC